MFHVKRGWRVKHCETFEAHSQKIFLFYVDIVKKYVILIM